MSHQPFPTLAPFNPPLGPQTPRMPIYSPNPTTLVLRDKVMSATRENFTVTTVETGQAVCTCSGKVFSAHHKHVFTDPGPGGAELFTLSRAIVSPLPHFTATRPDGSTLFEVKNHFKVIGSKITVSFANASDGQRISVQVDGNWGARQATMSIGGRGVALVRRDWANARAAFVQSNTYYVTVAPNVDLALMAAVCVCMDEVLQRNANIGTLGALAG